MLCALLDRQRKIALGGRLVVGFLRRRRLHAQASLELMNDVIDHSRRERIGRLLPQDAKSGQGGLPFRFCVLLISHGRTPAPETDSEGRESVSFRSEDFVPAVLAGRSPRQESGHFSGRVASFSGQTVRYSPSPYCIITGLIEVFCPSAPKATRSHGMMVASPG